MFFRSSVFRVRSLSWKLLCNLKTRRWFCDGRVISMDFYSLIRMYGVSFFFFLAMLTLHTALKVDLLINPVSLLRIVFSSLSKKTQWYDWYWIRHQLVMDSYAIGGRKRVPSNHAVEDQALDQIAKQVWFLLT